MVIYIEVVIILVLILIFLFWKLWETISRKNLLKEYEKNNDGKEKRKGGDFKGRDIGKPEQRPTDASKSVIGIDQLEGRNNIPKKVDRCVRKNSGSFRKLLNRRRKN